MGAVARRGPGRRPCLRPCGVCDQQKTSLVALLEYCTGLFLQRLRKARRKAAVVTMLAGNPGILVALTSLLADGPVFLFRNIALRFRKLRSVPGQGLSERLVRGWDEQREADGGSSGK